MFTDFKTTGIIRRALVSGLIAVEALNIRDFAKGRHHNTDDRPYGGGAGMVMKPEPLAAAIRSVQKKRPGRVIMLSPHGQVFKQDVARQLSGFSDLIFVCGRYEGVDQRICEGFVDDEISLGDYILTGGELAAMVIIDAVVRLLPGALGRTESALQDSFGGHSLEHAHYTRPACFEGMEVPAILLSGNHQAIDQWRSKSALMTSFMKRPDLLLGKDLSQEELITLKKWYHVLEHIISSQTVCGSDPLSGFK